MTVNERGIFTSKKEVTGMGPNLVKLTEILLVPSSFLVAALGTADTNPHREVVSTVGLIVS